MILIRGTGKSIDAVLEEHMMPLFLTFPHLPGRLPETEIL